MPTIADNIPAALRAILEDRNFIEQESAAVRAILEAPADAGKRYAAGKMYENFGLLCPALQAYQQTLALQPNHDKAAKRAARLEAEGASPVDEEKVYQLPSLEDSSSQVTQAEASDANSIGIIRWGHVVKPAGLFLKRLDNDGNWLVTLASDNQLSMRSRDNRIILMAVAGAFALLGFAGWIVWLVVQQVSNNESLGKPSRLTEAVLALLAFGITAVLGLRFFRKTIAVYEDGRIVESSGWSPLVIHRLQKGSRVRLDLDHQIANQPRHCLVSVIDDKNFVVKDVGTASVEHPCAQFQVRLAASLAALLDVPLEITGSARFDNVDLAKWMCRLTDAMQPCSVGGQA